MIDTRKGLKIKMCEIFNSFLSLTQISLKISQKYVFEYLSGAQTSSHSADNLALNNLTIIIQEKRVTENHEENSTEVISTRAFG